MNEVFDFGVIVLIVAGGFSLALLSSKLTQWVAVPTPALFLLAAAVVSDLFPRLSGHVEVRTVERIAVVALVVILLDGGMHVGWRRFRGSALPIATLGIAGTFATAGVMAVFAHYLFDFSWTTAGILGAALAPTDPAVMFSVLGKKEIGGRSGTILEGESGANDPVGIALMIGMIEFATHDDASFLTVVWELALEMAVGLAVGVAGAKLMLRLIRTVALPQAGLYPLRVLAGAGVVYGVASVAHGSGFLAVFVVGVLLGDERAPYKGEIERFHTSLASLAEIVVFVALGLTIDITNLFDSPAWWQGLALAALLAVVARPVVVGPLLLLSRLRWGERVFVMWGGLKGAVPILLGAFALLGGVAGAPRIYDIVFVVVLFSVVVQGSTMAWAARRLRIPMRELESEPWDISVRLREEPSGVNHFVVTERSRAAGRAIRDLPLGERTWISLLVREGKPVQPRGALVLEPDDELLVLTGGRDGDDLHHLFEGAR
jgi:cell volume regulation protein A